LEEESALARNNKADERSESSHLLGKPFVAAQNERRAVGTRRGLGPAAAVASGLGTAGPAQR